MSDSLWSHGLQHTRPLCQSAAPRACSKSSTLSQWCHPNISSSVIPFFSCLQSFPASGFFPMSQFFASGSRSIGASASVLPMNIQGWFHLGLTGFISCCSRDSKESSATSQFSSVQFSSVAQSCLTLCDLMNHCMPGLPVQHELPESTQTHVHWVGDAIQPSHPLSSPFPPALNLSLHEGLFEWVSSPHQVAKVLEFQLQHQSFQWTPRTDLL